MRTKTLLVACAALALGLATSKADPVYSANVVGYANVVIKGNGAYNLIANPLDDGNGNYLTNILNSALPKFSQVLTWDPITTYSSITKAGSPPNWPANTAVKLPPGVGFFVRNGSVGGGAVDVTNTFVGTVIVNYNVPVTNILGLGLTLQGSPIPYTGNIAISGTAGGDANMNFGGPLTKFSQIMTWDPVTTYSTVTKAGGAVTWGSTVAIGVGQGFFINNKNGPVTNVVETLTP
jgi:hypothetical protein